MGDSYKEVCWNNTVLKETSQLVSLRYLPEDSWEQSQDATTNTVLSRDSVEHDFKTQDMSSFESQDIQKTSDNINICVSPFRNDHVNNIEERFNLLQESPKRRLGESSEESSPKRMNFGGHSALGFHTTSSVIENSNCSTDYKIRVTSIESTSKDNGKVYNLEECQVCPRVVEFSTESTELDTILKSNSCTENTVISSASGIDKMNFKPRQASIDSALDSGIGDSCNSVDSREGKNDDRIKELKNGRLGRHCWQSKSRESLATRLPGTLFFLHCNSNVNFFLNSVSNATIEFSSFIRNRELVLSISSRKVHFSWSRSLFGARRL